MDSPSTTKVLSYTAPEFAQLIQRMSSDCMHPDVQAFITATKATVHYTGTTHRDTRHELANHGEIWNQEFEFEEYAPKKTIRQVYRAIATYPPGHIRGTGVNPQPQPSSRDSCLKPRDSYYEGKEGTVKPTWRSVHEHLTWVELPTPFISFWDKFELVLRWKNNFIRAGASRVDILCYNTAYIRHRLLDANALASTLEFRTTERYGGKHKHECLLYGGIDGRDCAGKFTFYD